MHRHRVNKKREELRVIEYNKQKIIRDAKMAIERKRLNKDEMLYLAGAAGITPKPDFYKQYE